MEGKWIDLLFKIEIRILVAIHEIDDNFDLGFEIRFF